MLSGVSLTNEKSYLVGKFARVALKTRNLDYNDGFALAPARQQEGLWPGSGIKHLCRLAHADVVMTAAMSARLFLR
jgi:assimilatory nitrate reductase catalytic subunit